MNRREFTQAMLTATAAIPFGITRAASQTRGGTLNTISSPSRRYWSLHPTSSNLR